MTKATMDTMKHVLKSNRKSKITEILFTFMHIYIIIFKEGGLYYSQFIFKIQYYPLRLQKERNVSVICRIPLLVHSYLKCKKRSIKSLALVARVRADHAHLRDVVVFVRPLQEGICESQSGNALKQRGEEYDNSEQEEHEDIEVTGFPHLFHQQIQAPIFQFSSTFK